MLQNSKLKHDLMQLSKERQEPIKAWAISLAEAANYKPEPVINIKTRSITWKVKPIAYTTEGSYNLKRNLMRFRALLKTRGFGLRVEGIEGGKALTVYKL